MSFVEESALCTTQKPESPKPALITLPEQHIPCNTLLLTTKNLEMYNTMTMTSELSMPSEAESRVVSWIKDRQQWATEMCDDIPELDENINSASPQDSSSQSTSICG